MEWAYIPHFYYKYYVYMYATASAAASPSPTRRELGQPAVDAYLNARGRLRRAAARTASQAPAST